MAKLQLSANAVKMDFLLGFVRAMLLICYNGAIDTEQF